MGTSKSVVLMLRHSTPGQGRIMRYAGPRQPELLEPRTMLSADPIEFGAVYVEQDLGSDAHADTIEITFEGGAPNTQLSWVEIFGDKLTPGLSFADMIFDTQSTGLGVDLAHDGLIADYEGDFEAIISVEDGSSTLRIDLNGFEAGEKLTLSIDVDEVQDYDPDQTNLELINEDLDPIASGAEFQGSLLTGYFTAAHYYDAEATAEFRNRYDANLQPTSLDLPLDDEGNNRDRTAGAVGELQQSPLPISISGTVYEDRNANLNQDPGDPGIRDVELALYTNQSGSFVFTGHTVTTNDDGMYSFSESLGLLPGEYQIRETLPAGYFSVGAEVGRVQGVTTGVVETTDILGEILIPLGGTHGVEYNFAEARHASIRGQVHLSTPDGDCWDETIEHRPVAGATILLLDADGNQVDESTTDADGKYAFTNLKPGQYTVFEITPDHLLEGGAQAGSVDGERRGLADGSRISEIELLSGDDGVEYEFCDHEPARLSGSVYHDRDNDGVPEAGEEGIANALLSLLDEEGSLVDSVETDEDGSYEFVGLRAGNYRVIQMQPNGWLDGTDRAGTASGRPTGRALNPGDEIESISLLWGDDARDYDFGELKPVSLEGRVHLSTPDGDCWDIDEDLLEPVAGAVVQLLDANGQILAESVTDADGNYFFENLEPGEYRVREITPEGLIEAGAHAGEVAGETRGVVNATGDIVDILLNSSEGGVNYDFCEHRPAVISGFVYDDIDNDGQREPGEGPIAGVLVQLFDEDGELVAEQRTDETGKYVFDGLPAGRYSLRQIQPPEYLDGIDAAGTINGESRGRALNPGDQIVDINIGWGEVGEEYNFGEIQAALITGMVHSSPEEDCWNDEDAAPLAGVRMLLLDDAGRTVAETVTDATGRYAFEQLRPGIYTVEQVQPGTVFDGGQRAGTAGGDASQTNRITSIDLAAGEIAEFYDFCEEPPSTLSGVVFVDGPPIELSPDEVLPDDLSEIRDGTLTPDDQRLANVVVELRNGVTGIAIDSSKALAGHYRSGPIRTVTDENGNYEFTGLPRGNYAVFEIQPEGYEDGIDTPGTTDGVALNPIVLAEDEPFFNTLFNTLVVKPDGFDAIVRIGLPAGAHSQFNNFSEVLTRVVDPPNVPPIIPGFPGPTPISPAVPLEQPGLYQYQRDLGPNVLIDNPLPDDGSSGAKAVTWHLSIIDGGQPRVSVEPGPTSFLFPNNVWLPQRLSGGEWTIELPDGATSRHFFGLEDSHPITGDFNGDGTTEIGVFAKGHWFIDLNGNGMWDSEDLWAKLGYDGDQPVVGDWDGDGKDDIGIFGRTWPDDAIALRHEHGLPDLENQPSGEKKNMPPQDEDAIVRNRRIMKHTARGRLREDIIDHVFVYGSAGDTGVVGDWNGDGIDTVGIFRAGQWQLDVDGNGRWTDPDEASTFGEPGDIPLVGDFDGDGIDDLAVLRSGKIYIDANGNRTLDINDLVVEFDETKGLPVLGDWSGEGISRVAAFNSSDHDRLTVASHQETE